ncbi:MAG: hypothetical protein LIO96_06215 [Lachnospiraceae bacterium]|nr:hypothetical protein [Lachnospiraceae bacterium]
MPAFAKTKHPSHIVFMHIILFCGLFLTGIFLASLRYTDETFWLGYQMENACRMLSVRDRTWPDFFLWILKNRFPIWVILCISGYFRRGNLILSAFTGWTGLSMGFLFAALAGRFFLRGILMDAAILLPQDLAYLPAYILLIKNKVKREPAYLIKALLLSEIFLAGAMGEYFINPWILQKIYGLVNLLP